jgi:hypothetical protein
VHSYSSVQGLAAGSCGHVGSEVLTATSMKMVVFWVVTPCTKVEVYRRFRGAYSLQHRWTSETLVNVHQTTQRYSPEDSHLLLWTRFYLICSSLVREWISILNNLLFSILSSGTNTKLLWQGYSRSCCPPSPHIAASLRSVLSMTFACSELLSHAAEQRIKLKVAMRPMKKHTVLPTQYQLL